MRGLIYSTLKNRKKEQLGKAHPDASKQMDYIQNKLNKYSSERYCVISVDCKNKEKIGNFANQGADYNLEPIDVYTHDFCVKKAIPYGVYDINKKFGFINLGVSYDTPEFAVNSIRVWWNKYGLKDYSHVEGIVITADGGGSNASRSNLFKFYLQNLADEINKKIIIHHYPPGKSKYNKVEHQLFNWITNNWRGHPLTDIDVILNYIRSTTTLAGLKVCAELDAKEYRTGIKLTKKEISEKLLIFRENFHGDWNYTIFPTSQKEPFEKILSK